MNLPSPENLLSTNEAAKLSGYSADYLARLGKSGKIKATRIGRSWFLDRSSFIAFVGEQGDRREAHARGPARGGGEGDWKKTSPVRRAVKALTTPVPQATFALPSSFSSHVVSALVAMLVVGCASILAAQIVPGAAEFLATQVAQVRTGLAYLVDDHAQSFRERIAKVQRAQKEQMQRVAHDINALTAELAMPPGTSFDRFAFKLPDEAPRARMLPWRIASERAVSLPHEFPTLTDLAVLTPQNVFEAVGASAFALGTYARDFIARSPEVIHRMNLVLGEAAIKATHLAIDADTALAYLVADTAPRSAEFVASVIGESGATLATLTAELPYFATDAFKTSALAFAQTAPRLARGGFALEYALAERFVAFTEIARTYGVGAISSSGALAYEVAAGGAELAAPASSLARLADTVAWSAAEISRGAVTTALEPFAFVADRARDSLAVVVTSIMPETPLGAGERTALSTYRTLHRIFDYTTDALAALFTPRPSVVTPFAIVPSPQAATTHPAVVYSSPTTVVYQTAPTSGLSADFVTNSLAGLRTAILNEVSDMVRPISGQVATNIQTINMVSKVEDLSDLIVRDGDFRKGHFDSPYITNATHIDSLELTVNGSATTTNLYVSGNTNIGGDLAVTGTITPAVIAVTGQSSAGYFTATSSTASTFPYASSTAITALDYLAVGRTATTTIRGDTATSTFSGRLSVGTTTPFGDALFVVGTNSPSLFVKGTDGAVGIGTTSPYAALSVNGRGVFNQDVSVDYLTATSTSVASTFNLAEITTGTTTNATSTTFALSSLTSGRVPYVTTGGRLIDSANLTFDGTILTAAQGSLTQATSTSFFASSLLANVFRAGQTGTTTITSTGFLGIGTTSPYAALSVNGRGVFNQDVSVDYLTATSTSVASTFNLAEITTGTTTNATSTTFALSSLTSGRVPYVTTGGRLIDSANLTFDGTILTAAQGSLTQATSTSFFASSLLANVFRAGQTGTTTITSTGFLGIGTTSPYAALSVNGRGVFNQDVSVDYLTATSTTATSTFEGGLAVETSGFVYDFSTGKVGIGLANPDSKLTISTTDSVQLKLHRDGNTIGNAANLQLALDDSAGNITNYASIQGTIESPTDGSEDGSLTFNTVLNAALTQRMIILSTGNVGIGTTSPYAALSVNGRGVFNQDISADYFTATSTTLASTFPFASTTMISATTASTTNLVISGITGTQCLRATLGVVSGTGADCGSGGGTPNSKWATSTVDTAAISPSGALRVGIGTTTPQWALQVASTTGPQLALSDLLTTSDRWTFRATSNSFYLATSSPSTFATSTSPVLAIDTNGFVGVATTSPYPRLAAAGRVAATAFNADNASATSTFAGGFDVGSGALQYDFSRNVTSIERLDTGALSFETNAGVVSWFDFPVTSSASANTAESYTAQIDSNAVLTVYGESDGSGGVQNLKVGVATTSPWGVLSVEQSTETYSLLVGNSGSSTPAFAVSGVNRNGAVAIATSTANSSFATSSVLLVGSSGVNGAVAVFGGSAGYCSIDPVRTALQCASDISLKYNVNALDGSLDALLALRPVTYNWNIEATSTAPHVVFIAQEVEPLFPDLVTSDNGLLSLNYAGLTPYLTKAVQELAARTNGFVSLYTSTTPQAITLDEAGGVGIGLDTPTHLLDVAGGVAAI